MLTEEYATEKQKVHKVKNLSHDVCNTLEKIAKMVGYDGEIKRYSARGTFITKMMKIGYDAPEIAVIAGNSAATIYRDYFKPKDAETITKELNEIFG